MCPIEIQACHHLLWKITFLMASLQVLVCSMITGRLYLTHHTCQSPKHTAHYHHKAPTSGNLLLILTSRLCVASQQQSAVYRYLHWLRGHTTLCCSFGRHRPTCKLLHTNLGPYYGNHRMRSEWSIHVTNSKPVLVLIFQIHNLLQQFSCVEIHPKRKFCQDLSNTKCGSHRKRLI